MKWSVGGGEAGGKKESVVNEDQSMCFKVVGNTCCVLENDVDLTRRKLKVTTNALRCWMGSCAGNRGLSVITNLQSKYAREGAIITKIVEGNSTRVNG